MLFNVRGCHSGRRPRLALRPLECRTFTLGTSAQGVHKGPDSEGAQTERRPLRAAGSRFWGTFTSDFKLTTTQAGTGIWFCGDTCIEISYVHGRKGGSSTGRSDRGGEPQRVLFSSEANAGWEAPLCVLRVAITTTGGDAAP